MIRRERIVLYTSVVIRFIYVRLYFIVSVFVLKNVKQFAAIEVCMYRMTNGMLELEIGF